MISDLHYLLGYSVSKYADRPAVRERAADGGIVEYSYPQMQEDIHALAENIIRSGNGGKKTVIIGDNCYHWIVCFWAVILGGGVAIPFDRELSPEDISSQMLNCGAEAAFCSKQYLDKLIASLSEARSRASAQWAEMRGGSVLSKGVLHAVAQQNDYCEADRACTAS